MGFFIRKSDDPEQILREIEALYQAEAFDQAKKEIRRGRRQFPKNLDFKEWEAMLAADEERFEEAHQILESILAEDPDRISTLLEYGRVLHELGRFREALDLFEELSEEPAIEEDPEDHAWVFFMIGSCRDRLGHIEDADAAFREAENLAPDEYPMPPRLSQDEFEALVEQALDSLPDKYDAHIQQVAVVVKDYPSHRLDDPFLLGLYEGVPRTERTHESRDNLDHVTLFKRNLEIEFPDPDELRDEIRKTIVHEIGHHFGLEEEDMGDYA